MKLLDKDALAALIRDARNRKGLTQQQLADEAGLSLRSVQRIENGEVMARTYTLQTLAARLEIGEAINALLEKDDSTAMEEIALVEQMALSPIEENGTAPFLKDGSLPDVVSPGLNKTQRTILSIGTGILLFLGTLAYIAQSPRFPETLFEGSLLWMGVTAGYMVFLMRLWKRAY